MAFFIQTKEVLFPLQCVVPFVLLIVSNYHESDMRVNRICIKIYSAFLYKLRYTECFNHYTMCVGGLFLCPQN